MVYIITISTYPQHLSEEVGKTYIEAIREVPIDRSLSKPIIPAAVQTGPEGFKVTSISSVKEGKLKEALDRETKRMLIFAKIKGFRYTIDTAYDAVEAMAFMGMEAPDV